MRLIWDCAAMAFRTARALKSQSCAIDGLYRDKERVVGEVSYCYVSWEVHSLSRPFGELDGDPDTGTLALGAGTDVGRKKRKLPISCRVSNGTCARSRMNRCSSAMTGVRLTGKRSSGFSQPGIWRSGSARAYWLASHLKGGEKALVKSGACWSWPDGGPVRGVRNPLACCVEFKSRIRVCNCWPVCQVLRNIRKARPDILLPYHDDT